MIGYLRGPLRHREGSTAIIDVSGVGWAIQAPSRALDAWAVMEEAEVWVSTQVREDAIALYGFASWTDRSAFELLLSVSGVGPKLALAALDTHGSAGLSRAVAAEDLPGLCQIPGVGKRTAQRLLLELANKLPSDLGDPTSHPLEPESTDTLGLALKRLGYNRSEIERVKRELPGQGVEADAPIERRLKAALRILYGTRP